MLAFVTLAAALEAQGFVDSSQGVGGVLEGELAIQSPDCRFFVAGGRGRAFYGEEEAWSAEQWASACLFSGIFHLELSHHLEWEVRPSFAAPRLYPRAPYSRERIGVIWRSLDLELDQGLRMLFGDVETSITVALVPQQTEMDVRMDMMRFVGASGGSVTIFRVRVSDVMQGLAAFMVDFAPLALNEIRLGRDDVRLDAEAGVLMGVISRPDGVPETPDETLLQLTTFSARTQLRGGEPRRHWSGGYARTGFATLDGHLAVEDRLSAAAGARLGRWELGGQSFFAFTNLFDAVGRRQGAITGGATVWAARDLGRGLKATALGELARTYYATLDETEPVPTVAARGLLVLSARVGR